MHPALLFGLSFDLMSFGILTAQVYVYYVSFPNDRIILKIAVIWVYLVGVAQTGLTLLDSYDSFSFMQDLVQHEHQVASAAGIFNYAIPTDHLWLSITASTGAVAIVIQSLYAHRIYLISKKRWLAIIIVCMSFGQLGSSIIGTCCFSQGTEFAGYIMELSPVLCTWGFEMLWGPINAACDLTITICMVTFLLKYRKKTLRHKTRLRIMKVVQIIVETGMAIAVLMTVYTILFIFADYLTFVQASLFFALPGLMMSKVYSNSMLVLLNNRANISDGRSAVGSVEFIEASVGGASGDIELRTGGRD